jgi:hypothetical protein
MYHIGSASNMNGKINHLTPELNPSEQPCLPGIFTEDFKF